MWRICPRSPYRWFKSEYEARLFFNTDSIKSIRQNLYRGIKDNNCHDCYEAEDKGGMSYRKALKKDRELKISNKRVVQSPKVIELKFSNLCNLKCVFCASVCSSLWEQDVGLPDDIANNQKLDAKVMSKIMLDWLKVNFKHIDSINFFGGEPALQQEFYEVVDLFLNNTPETVGKKELSFSSNTYYPKSYKDKFESAIQRVLDTGHTVFPRISLDGIGEKQTYQRTGLVWNKFEDNVLSFLEKFNMSTPGVDKVRANIALNVINLVYCDEIVQYLDKIGYSDIEPHYNFIVKPDMLYMRNWGSLLSNAVEMIEQQDFLTHTKYKDHILNMAKSFTNIEPNMDHIRKTKDWLDNYDKKSGFDFNSVFEKNRYMFDAL